MGAGRRRCGLLSLTAVVSLVAVATLGEISPAGVRSAPLSARYPVRTRAGMAVCHRPGVDNLAHGSRLTSSLLSRTRRCGGAVSFDRLPLSFEVNRGQAPAAIDFLAHVGPSTLLFERHEAVLAAGPAGGTLALRFNGVARRLRVTGIRRLPGTANYFLGNDPRQWHADIPTYAGVRYHQIYPGIDLTFGGTGAGLEYDWIVAPHADPGRIRMSLAGVRALRIAAGGGLLGRVGDRPMSQRLPVVYQRIGGVRRPVETRYLLGAGQVVGLQLGRYDRNRPLIIDPVIRFADYLGGDNWDYAAAVAVDRAGNSYITGGTGSLDFPQIKAIQRGNRGGLNGADAFVAKLNAAGNRLLYSTYLGGQEDDAGAAIAVDVHGRAYVTGFTGSPDFPVRRPLAPSAGGRCVPDRAGMGSAFVAKLDTAGSALVYSTCLGGSRGTWGGGIAVRDGSAYVAGTTASSNFPTVHAVQRGLRGRSDAFVARLAPLGRALVFSTYLGGAGDESANAIAVDAHAVYVGGATTSDDFPTVHPLQPVNRGGQDAFLAALPLSGRTLSFATYLGGSADDAITGIAADRSGVFVAGGTSSADFPTAHPLQATAGGHTDAFIAKLDLTGDAFLYSTYLGGSQNDEATAIALDSAGDAFITGSTTSPDFPLVQPIQHTYAGGFYYGDAFVARLTATGDRVLFSTYFGGQGDDTGQGIAVRPPGDAIVVGGTSSTDFPATAGLPSPHPQRGNAFALDIRDGPGG